MKRRILLVDDELAILLTLKAILEMHHFQVDTAASAGEAIQKLQEGVYEMVITDMRMENEKSGYDVMQCAKRQPYSPAVAILTAFPSLGSDWKGKGAHSLLVKPVNTDELLRQIEHLMIRHGEAKANAAALGPSGPVSEMKPQGKAS